MMQVPLPDGGVFAVIETGNLTRLREGKPLKVGNCLIAFTPDMERFMELLGANGELPQRGEMRVQELPRPVTPEQIQDALQRDFDLAGSTAMTRTRQTGRRMRERGEGC